jgi:hypothetical protein
MLATYPFAVNSLLLNIRDPFYAISGIMAKGQKKPKGNSKGKKGGSDNPKSNRNVGASKGGGTKKYAFDTLPGIINDAPNLRQNIVSDFSKSKSTQMFCWSVKTLTTVIV